MSIARTSPFREDFWSEDATWTLVDAWGTRLIDLVRENLQQKDWQSVADAVNAIHGHDPTRTDVQCKNRIDTLKKQYEAEKARAMDSPDGSFVSTWPFYTRMDELIGSLVSAKKPSPPSVPLSSPTRIPFLGYRRPVSAVAEPVVRLPQKRPAPGPAPAVDNSYFRRNYSAVAAAAAAEIEEDDELEDSESEEAEEATDGDGATRLAKAVERLAETYDRVGKEKQKFEIEREKIRMQFAKDMEVQRMQFFMELEKIMMATEAKQPDSNVCDGPATVGGIQDGDFKIGNSAGTIDNITQFKLYRPGSVGFVPKSELCGDEEKIQAICIKGEGTSSSDGEKIQAIRIKGEGTTSSDGEKIQAIRIKGEGTTSSP